MIRAFVAAALCGFFVCTAPAQTTTPAFEISDVHVSPHHTFPFADGGGLHGDRYIYRQATMLDLISKAYGLDPSNVQGGPIWLETDRFDVVAKAPPKTSQATLKLMLQSLLMERFNLSTHIGSALMPAYLLTVGPANKPKMTASEEAGDPACVPQPPPSNAPASAPVYISAKCHNLTMESFAEVLHQFAGGYLAKPVVDSTGLKGTWDFEFKWSPANQLKKAGSDGISIFDAMDKQLGLKLDLQTAPRPIMIVDSVNETPKANPPGLEKILPPLPVPQFEVATIKPSKPDSKLQGTITGSQVNLQGATLRFLMAFAWDLNVDDTETLINAPKWFDSDKFDILAKPPIEAVVNTGPSTPPIDIEDLREMMQRLLAERFEIKTHKEDRTISAYTLTAPNSKLRKADPLSRTRCAEGPGPDGKDPRIESPIVNRLLTCQNMTMAQIGDEFQRVASGYIYSSVLDATGIKGSWDFTLSFTSTFLMKGNAAGSGDPSASGTPSEPNGAISFFDAVNKQLGLKLEKQKRQAAVLVIDHIEEKPTEN